MTQKIKVLIVDDSLIFRHAVEECLRNESDIQIAGSVRNGVKALEFISGNDIDLVTLDIEMPEMNGIETLKAIQSYNQEHKKPVLIGVIMLSALTQRGADITIQALELGAFDFITKPQESSESKNLDILKRQLVQKIHFFGAKRLAGKSLNHQDQQKQTELHTKHTDFVPRKAFSIHALFIGVSTGGPKALTQILPKLCDKISLPIFIVQHMPKTFTASLAESLDRKCSYKVKEGNNREVVKDKTVYIAPGGKHMLVSKNKDGMVEIVINDQQPQNGCKPSVDVLFRSAPLVYKEKCIALIMTGMGCDGAASLRTLKRTGAVIIAQDMDSSVVWGMPGSAVETGFVDMVVALEKIPDVVENVVKGNR